MPPTLPSRKDWRAFKTSRNDFEPGVCEHCLQWADKLVRVDTLLVCHSCREWIKEHGQNGRT